MKFGVVGNRVGWNYEKVAKELTKLGISENDVIISGGADGVDKYAQWFAKSIGCEIDIIYPNWGKYGKSAGFVRNEKIANRCDVLVAFNKKEHSGTANTISHARKLGRKIIIYER